MCGTKLLRCDRSRFHGFSSAGNGIGRELFNKLVRDALHEMDTLSTFIIDFTNPTPRSLACR
jgi:hypothetical protein